MHACMYVRVYIHTLFGWMCLRLVALEMCRKVAASLVNVNIPAASTLKVERHSYTLASVPCSCLLTMANSCLRACLYDRRLLQWLTKLLFEPCGPEGIQVLCDALNKNKAVSTLDLGANMAGDKGAIAIADLLQVNGSPCLTSETHLIALSLDVYASDTNV
jgi:hypothetical protein